MTPFRVVARGGGGPPGRLWEVPAAIHILTALRPTPVDLTLVVDGPLLDLRHPIEELGLPVDLRAHHDDLAIEADVRIVVDTDVHVAHGPHEFVLGPDDGPSVLAALLELVADTPGTP